MTRICKDCREENPESRTVRPAPHPGPRCTTHYRKVVKQRKTRNHSLMSQNKYGMKDGEYQALKEFQGGRCAICGLATGASKNLSIDHDHTCCPETPTCGKCTRGELCTPCNDLLGRARDKVEFFERAIDYLKHPPAQVRRALVHAAENGSTSAQWKLAAGWHQYLIHEEFKEHA